MAIQEEHREQVVEAPVVEAPSEEPKAPEGEIKARGYWEQVFRRFRRDRIAVIRAPCSEAADSSSAR